MIWSVDFRDAIELLLKNYEGSSFRIKYFEPVTGGDINAAYKIIGEYSSYFIKINEAERHPDLFEKEKESLNAIASSGTIKTPKVITEGRLNQLVYLVLEWIDASVAEPAAIKDMGIRLAKMHLHRSTHYGFHTDNYMGSLQQKNQESSDWLEFFVKNRLLPQVELASSKNLLNIEEATLLDKLIEKLPSFYDKDKPSLVHGDLWIGNVMFSSLQEPVLIDPATYYGNREIDIAMTRLFGGFAPVFYEAYHETFPLRKGWEDRCEIWNLYPLLVHLNLFGRGYINQIKLVLHKFVR